jgi:hypothetical protein
MFIEKEFSVQQAAAKDKQVLLQQKRTGLFQTLPILACTAHPTNKF